MLFVGLTCLVFLGLGRERAGLGQCVQPQRAPFFFGRVCVLYFGALLHSPRGAQHGGFLVPAFGLRWVIVGGLSPLGALARTGSSLSHGFPWLWAWVQRTNTTKRAIPSTVFVLPFGSTAEPTRDASGSQGFLPSSSARSSLCS